MSGIPMGSVPGVIGADAFSAFADAVWNELRVGHAVTGSFGAVDEWAGAIDSQTVRDAMKLAPSAGAAAAGSVDDHLDDILAGVGATGSITQVVTVNDANGNPLDGVQVTVYTDAAKANLVASGYTNTSGQVTFELDAGTYYVWKSLAGYNFSNPSTMVVA